MTETPTDSRIVGINPVHPSFNSVSDAIVQSLIPMEALCASPIVNSLFLKKLDYLTYANFVTIFA